MKFGGEAMMPRKDSIQPITVQDPAKDISLSASFESILFLEPDARVIDEFATPEVFRDLNLYQIVDAITAGRDEYSLKPFFYTTLTTVAAINYRHEVLTDLEDPVLAGYINLFASGLRQMRHSLALREKLNYEREKQRWFLDAAECYCSAIDSLRASLAKADTRSQGLLSFRDWVTGYCDSETFRGLRGETKALLAALKSITYSLHIRGRRVTVGKYGSETDYGADVLKTFAKFSQGATKEYRFDRRPNAEMNHVEAAILDMVATLYPDTFSSLDNFCSRHASYLDGTIARFDREVQFYLACLDHVTRFQETGLVFCHAAVSDSSKEILGRNVFDLALATSLLNSRSPVITNDFYLKDPERIFIVTGPNQGGKTTFGRCLGQLHYLASLGCPVPAAEARLFLFDRIFTHFEKAENVRSLKGRLEDELHRIRHILDRATPNSILIMNEAFLSTTVNDSVFLSRQILQRIVELDLLCVSVTFLDELASFGPTAVSMVSNVDPKDPTSRTFKLIRKPADGLAYAMAIAQKYRLTSADIEARILRSGTKQSVR